MNRGMEQICDIKRVLESIGNKLYAIISINSMLSGIFLIGTGSLLAQIIGIILMPIITRLYNPQDFGLFAVYLSIISIIMVIASLKYELAIPIPKDDIVASNLLILCLLLISITTSIMIIFVYIFGIPFLILIGAYGLNPYLWLVIIDFFVIGIYQVFIYWAIRRRNYGIITYTKIYQSFGGNISKIIFGFLSFGPLGLMLGDLISQICGIGKVISRTWKDDKILFKDCSIKGIYSAALEYRKFPLFSCSSAIINTIAFQIPVILISSLYGFKEVGYYTLSYSIIFLPGSLICAGIAQVFLGEVTKIMRDDRKKLESLYLSVTYKLAIIIIPLISIIALIAPFVFPIIFGEKWLDAGIYCLPLALLAISNFIISPTSSLEVYGFNHWKLLWDICRTVLVIVCFFIGSQIRLPIISTLWAYAILMVLAYIICFIMNIKAIRIINVK